MKKATFIIMLACLAIKATGQSYINITSPNQCPGTLLTAVFTVEPGEEIANWTWTLNGQPIPPGFDADPTDHLLIANGQGYFSIQATDIDGFTIYSNGVFVTKPDVSTSVFGSNSFCEGSGALVSLDNYNPSINYEWREASAGVVGTGAFINVTTSGSFTVTGTDPSTGCSKTSITRVFTAKPQPSAVISSTGGLCTGSTLSVPDMPGNKYTWYLNGVQLPLRKSTLKPKDPGYYSVKVNNNGCIALSSSTPVNPTPSGTVLGNAEACPNTGESLETGYHEEIQWQRDGVDLPGENSYFYIATMSGNYTAKITDYGCTAITPKFKFTSLAAINAHINPAGGNKDLDNGSVELVASAGHLFYYQWYKDGSPFGTGTYSRNLLVTEPGTYYANISHNGNCGSNSNSIVVTGTAGSFKPSTAATSLGSDEISVYPNPSAGIYHIDAAAPVDATVRDLTGKVVSELKQTSQIDISSLPDGIYLLQLTDANGGIIKAARLIKQ